LGLQIEVGQTEYFRLEAACWLARARAEEKAPAPLPADQVATLTALLRARHQAAQKQFDEAWSYYKQERSSAFFVYVWSNHLLQVELDQTNDRAERLAALEAHHRRVQDLEALVDKVRRLGIKRPLEAGEIQYFRLEAEYWLARARATAEDPAPRPALAAKSARRLFDWAWDYYKKAKSNVVPVHVWSHILLELQLDMTTDQAGQIAALEAHRQHMIDLESLVIQVRRLGYGLQIGVGQADYFRIDAECLLARARTPSDALPLGQARVPGAERGNAANFLLLGK
jgi:hypothetical protein